MNSITIKDREQCNNKQTSLLTEILTIPDDEDVLTYTDDNGLIWCFEVKEIDYLISNEKNPYTNIPLPINFIDLLEKYKESNRYREMLTVEEGEKDERLSIRKMKDDINEALNTKGLNGTSGDPYVNIEHFLNIKRHAILPDTVDVNNNDSIVRYLYNNRYTKIGNNYLVYMIVKEAYLDETKEDIDQLNEFKAVLNRYMGYNISQYPIIEYSEENGTLSVLEDGGVKIDIGSDNLDLELSDLDSKIILNPFPNNTRVIELYEINVARMPDFPNGLLKLKLIRTDFNRLPTLPQTLQELSIEDIKINNIGITSLPPLPNNLEYLELSYTLIARLPELPNDLTSLVIKGNVIRSLPRLPNNLKELYIEDVKIDTLPSLPSNLEKFSLFNYPRNKISLPPLPLNLKEFVISDTGVKSLSSLPDTLKVLGVHNERLDTLPTSFPNLEKLELTYDKLTSLPTLPDTLVSLNVSNNKLSSLPPLPDGLTFLNVENNKLRSLGKLPSTLSSDSIRCKGNFVNCKKMIRVGIRLRDKQ